MLDVPSAARQLAPSAWRAAAARPLDRESLCAALAEQNRRWQAGPATAAAIERLRDPKTVAVVTGQQAGLFGGPALTAWKILTSIRLAEQLQRQGQPAAPVFWIASEDHDFEEARQTTILTRDGKLLAIACRPAFDGQPSVGAIRLDAAATASLAQLSDALPHSDFAPDLLRRLGACYRPGHGWCDAFAMWLHEMFAPFGLIILDPRDARLRALTQSTFESVIDLMPSVMERLLRQARNWRASGKTPQVNIRENATPLFLEIEGRRTALLSDGQSFYPKSNPESRYTSRELLHILRDAPLRITPNALLRPVIQDQLLPTVAQVVGPAEAAYLEQSRLIYEALQLAPPARWPRASVTLVEKRHAKLLSKLALVPEDIFLGSQALLRRAALASADKQALDAFERVKTTIEGELDRLQGALRASDSSLADALHRGREKIFHQISGLEQRFLANQAQRQEALARQLERATDALAPYGKPQERALNLLSFLVKYGPGLIGRVYERIRLDTDEHQWLAVEPEVA
ncbi:MAG: bacillithiol biosynthesis cysteine-adding enzyme BshC [Chloracidobacterium sp. CP2_5A]|nr:MAG: bacillithiol biosynthesis cysteine-adding enzyme BshC [Chloracidobacterium sp. CP2_5A]